MWTSVSKATQQDKTNRYLANEWKYSTVTRKIDFCSCRFRLDMLGCTR